jgi:TolB-like protein
MIFRFESCVVDGDRCELVRAGKPVSLEPQVLSILLYLLQNRARVVSRDDLLSAVWNGRLVSDSTLSSRMTAVRHAIGDSGAHQRLVRTVTRTGYRFVGVVAEGSSREESKRGDVTSGPPTGRPSIAVVPFANLSDDLTQDRFIAGIVDDLIASLARFRQLAVVPRSVTLPCTGADAAQVALKLGVRYVLEGTFRKEGDRVRVMTQLVDASTTSLLWANRFDGNSRSSFDLQDQITAQLVSAVASRLEQAEYDRVNHRDPGEPDAYSLTLRGLNSLHRWTRDGIDEALRLFRTAIEIDPGNAAAHAMSSYCYVQRQSYGWLTDHTRDRAEGAALARAAAELGADDALALTRAAHAISVLGGDVDGGAVLAERAIRLNPNLDVAWYVSGWIMLFAGKPQAACEHLERARHLSGNDRLIFKIDAASAYAHFFCGRHDESASAAANALRGRPSYLTALRVAGASNVLAGRMKHGREFISRMGRLDPTLRMSGLAEIIPLRRQDFSKWADALHGAGLPD